MALASSGLPLNLCRHGLPKPQKPQLFTSQIPKQSRAHCSYRCRNPWRLLLLQLRERQGDFAKVTHPLRVRARIPVWLL